jgi:DNA-binding CsgD family transcriptional regulator
MPIDTTKINSDGFKKLFYDMLKHYEGDVEVDDTYVNDKMKEYDSPEELIRGCINHYEPSSVVTDEYIKDKFDKYNVKKKAKPPNSYKWSGEDLSGSSQLKSPSGYTTSKSLPNVDKEDLQEYVVPSEVNKIKQETFQASSTNVVTPEPLLSKEDVVRSETQGDIDKTMQELSYDRQYRDYLSSMVKEDETGVLVSAYKKTDKQFADQFKNSESPLRMIFEFNKRYADLADKFKEKITGAENQNEYNAIQQSFISETQELSRDVAGGLIGVDDKGNIDYKDLLETYNEKLRRNIKIRLKEKANAEKDPYLKDVLNGLAGASADLLNTPQYVLAALEKGMYAIAGKKDEEGYWEQYGKYMKSVADGYFEAGQRYDQGIVDQVDDGDYKGAVGQVIKKGSEQIPLLLTLAAGGASGYSKASLGLLGTNVAAKEYMDDSNEDDASEIMQLVNAVTHGLAEFAFEGIGTMSILDDLSRTLKRGGRDAFEKYTRDGIEVVLKDSNKKLGILNSPAVKEMTTEVATELTQQISDKLTVNPEQKIGEGIGDVAIVSASVGGLLGSPKTAMRYSDSFGGKEQLKEEVTKLYKKIPKNLDAGIKRKILDKMIEREVIKKEASGVDEAFETNVKEEVNNINEEITKIYKDAKKTGKKTEVKGEQTNEGGKAQKEEGRKQERNERQIRVWNPEENRVETQQVDVTDLTNDQKTALEAIEGVPEGRSPTDIGKKYAKAINASEKLKLAFKGKQELFKQRQDEIRVESEKAMGEVSQEDLIESAKTPDELIGMKRAGKIEWTEEAKKKHDIMVKEKAKNKVSEGFSDIASAFGGKVELMGDERISALSGLRKVAEGSFELGMKNTQQLIEKVKKWIDDNITDVKQKKELKKLLEEEKQTFDAVFKKQKSPQKLDVITEEEAINIHKKTPEPIDQKERRKKVTRWLKKNFSDPSANLTDEMLYEAKRQTKKEREAGEKVDNSIIGLANKAIYAFNLRKGMSAATKKEYDAATGEVLGDFVTGKKLLSKKEQEILADFIEAKRIKELDELKDSRGEERLLHPGGASKETSDEWLNAFNNKTDNFKNAYKIDDYNVKELEKRADVYFNTMQKQLKKLYDSGSINKQLYDKLRHEQPYYSPRLYISRFIEQVDKGGDISGIKALEGGSTENAVVDIQVLMNDVISRTNNIIARNNSLRKLHEFAGRLKEKSLFKKATLTEDSKQKIQEEIEYERIIKDYVAGKSVEDIAAERKIKKDKIQKFVNRYNQTKKERGEYIKPEFIKEDGYTVFKFNKDGKTDAVLINKEIADEYDVSPHPQNIQQLARLAYWVSGTGVLKAAATGYNWEFAVRNLPLDIMHILTTTEEYSSFYPVGLTQMASDMFRVIGKWNETKKQAIEEGIGMDFLTLQGKVQNGEYKPRTTFGRFWNKFGNLLSHINENSEYLTRLSLRERAIKNRKLTLYKDINKLEAQGLSVKEISERLALSEESVNSLKDGGELVGKDTEDVNEWGTGTARNYLDFSKGGEFVKLLDNVVPYIGAGINVTRGTLRAAERNPKIFAFKMAQLGGVAMMLTAFNRGDYSGQDDEKKKEIADSYKYKISDEMKARNFIMMTPFHYKDEDGNKRYVYLRFPKDNSQQVITGMFEALYNRVIHDETVNIDKLSIEFKSLFKNISDISSLPPIFTAMLGSQFNKDFFYKSDIWRGYDFNETWERSQEYYKWTPERFKYWGELTGASPVRTQYFMKQFFTSNNLVASGIGRMFDVMTPIENVALEQNDEIVKNIGNSPFVRRFVKFDNPYILLDELNKFQLKRNINKSKNNHQLERITERVGTGEESVTTVVDFLLEKGASHGVAEAERLLDRYMKDVSRESMPFLVKIVSYYSDPVVKADIIKNRLENMGDDEKMEFLKGLNENGLVSKRTEEELIKNGGFKFLDKEQRKTIE